MTKRSKNPNVLGIIKFYNRYKNSKKTRTAKEWQAILADKYDVHYASAVNVYGMFKKYNLTHLFKGRGGYQRRVDHAVDISYDTFKLLKDFAKAENVSVRQLMTRIILDYVPQTSTVLKAA